jgi:hypothetical protein
LSAVTIPPRLAAGSRFDGTFPCAPPALLTREQPRKAGIFTQGSAHASGDSFNEFKPGLELLRDCLLLSDGRLIRNYTDLIT